MIRVLLDLGVLDLDCSSTLVRAVRLTCEEEGVERAEFSVALLGDDDIADLNHRYLDVEGPTDVIAFTLGSPLHDVVGDVYVGLQQAERQAEREQIPLLEELVRLVVHGTLHVLGYDHPEGRERAACPMFERQEAFVRAVIAEAPPGT